MGTRGELEDLLGLVETSGIRPVVDEIRPMDEARAAFERLERGDAFGKLVLTV